ncbi:MAG TPA: heme o synthase [Geminicoccus sp.]|jgi:protoheme IX farnesyltransferase|uniref:heme o synthase n=1 Tax=Geminicoccus sp. TaxID=2024832 RepID=UPI002E3343EE|nr:heme o synthase [Geminicoccus sp.]HEX2526119.1 heme o synthase [Geminicoccus sp.]
MAVSLRATGTTMEEAAASSARDYVTLMKPNVMQLVVFTGAVGLFLAPGTLHPLLAAVTLLAILVAAGASAAINNWYDVDIDVRMARTRNRPTAAGRIQPGDALGFGVVLSILSVMVLGLATNWLAAGLLAFTIGFYVFIYTMWLKRRTPQNIVIGGAAGALPPVVAWAAVTGRIDVLPVLMFLIVFLWTPPHFWALALYRSGDYAKVGVPMLPVIAGGESTRNHILWYTVVLGSVALLPAFMGYLGPVYGVVAFALSAEFFRRALVLRRTRSDVVAMRLFRFSIIYLFALFAAMVVDKVLPVAVL